MLRERLLIAAAWWTACLIAITELLSAFHAIRRDTLVLAWIVTAALTFAADFLLTDDRRGGGAAAAASKATSTAEAFLKKDWFLLGSLIAILATTGMTALVAPPNGWDTTLQHMPRVMEWLAQGSVGLFPTNYYVQDFAPPLTEWAMLHLVLLQGSNHFVNLMQWCGSLGSALVAVELTIRNPNFCDGCGTQRCNPGPDPAEMDDLCHRGAISTDRSSVGVAE